ncbi:MAG: FAD-binding oxidoreductase, partial [Terracidiphilus sp.]
MGATATITREEALERLAAIAGDEHVRVAREAVRVAPSSAQEIGEILRFANGNGLTVLPLGSGSKSAWGNPVAAEIELSLDRLNALHEHAWQDLTCAVQSGCQWATMQRELAKHGQMVAADALWPERATVGGVVATNDGGALRLKYGGLRDLVIGMTIVLADGTIAKSGGKVVKNVAGYDLHKLMIGSFGTLGVITEVNFRLHPLEQHVRTWTVEAPNALLLADPLSELLHSQMMPSSIQLCMQKDQCALQVRVCTRPECFEDHSSRLRRICGKFSM